mmetsp:Transcript_79210/g.96867  ORF Transcript_79210/g.96867 Transcript_79210/m.96867 type:complete len:85 (+) Transcript_79210:95-349(+)
MQSLNVFVISLLFTLLSFGVDGRKPGDHGRNAAAFFVGFAIGLVIVAAGVVCWITFEGCELCRSGGLNKSGQKQGYAATDKRET